MTKTTIEEVSDDVGKLVSDEMTNFFNRIKGETDAKIATYFWKTAKKEIREKVQKLVEDENGLELKTFQFELGDYPNINIVLEIVSE